MVAKDYAPTAQRIEEAFRRPVRYELRDPAVGDLLEVARRIFNNQLISTQGLLRELQREARRR
jgi:hypothetical protein